MKRSPLWLRMVYAAASLALVTCAKDQDDAPCGVDDPAGEIAWLKEQTEVYAEDEYSYYMMATLQARTVFYYGNCNPAINYASYLQTCQGDTLGFTTEFDDLLGNRQVVWKPENAVCTFEDL